jgi:eukaryotic-like serine/threonine-protein kinase
VAFDEFRRIIREEEPIPPSSRISTLRSGRTKTESPRRLDLDRLVAGDLDWIVLKALDKDRTRRYGTAAAFAKDIWRYLNDQLVEASPPSAIYRFRKFVRRNRVAFTTVAMVAAALVIGLVISVSEAIRANNAIELAEDRLTTEVQAKEDSRKQLQLAEKAELEATRQLFESRLAQARAAHRSRRIGQRLESLESVREAAKLAQRLNLPSARHLELRNTAIAALALPDLHPIDQLPRKSPGQCNADIDGAFLRYARADENGSISVRRISDGSEIFTLPGAGAERWPLLSRDGQLLSVVSNQGIELWDLEPSPPVNRIPFRDDAVCHSFSLDSRQYVHGNRDGSISIYNLPFAGSPRKIAAKRMATRIAFDPGGQRLAAICGNSVEIRDIATGKLLIELPHRASLESLAWRPDGHGLAVSCNDRHIYLWNVETGQQWMALDEVRNGGMAVAFNHAGNLLASNGWDTTLRLWDLRTTKPLFSTYSVSACIPRFSTDDRRLADDWRDGRLRFWELAVDCGEYRTFVRGESSGNYDRPSVRFDGRMLAVALRDGFGFWDLEGNTQLAFVSVPGCDQVLFEPSGSLLVVGAGGLVRWPVREDSGKKGTFKVGPPQPVSVEGSIVRIDASADGRVIGLSQYDGGRVLRADRLDQPVRLAPQEDARYVAVSADGTRVATASHVRLITRIWDTSLGKLLTELPLTNGHVVFSPDGRWLAGSGSGCSLWNVETGEEGPRIGGSSPAFSPDGKLLATETGYGVIRLVDPHTGLEYARLEDPTQDRALFLTFSPDGTRLIATNDDSRSIHVWDLRKIRNELRKVDLDWDQPAFPLAKPGDRCNLVIQIDLGK